MSHNTDNGVVEAVEGEQSDAARLAHDESQLPAHRPRRTDYDPRAAKRAERQVAIMFGLSAVFTILFVVAFVQVGTEEVLRIPFFGTFGRSNLYLGLTFGLATLLIGTGAIHWAKKLMNDHEVVAERHPLRSPDESREEAVAAFEAGAEDSGFASRPIIRRSLLGAMALFPIPLVMVLRDLGPLPGKVLEETAWKPGMRIVGADSGIAIKPSDIPVGGIVQAIPADLPEIQEIEGNLNSRAKDVVLLVRMNPADIVSQQGGTAEEPWDFNGIMCFSRICTHVGCPIALYEQRSHHLLCPCHQSTFDLADSANVVFGPAARELPQLPIMLDAEGYFVARDGFNQPVGPSYWERS